MKSSVIRLGGKCLLFIHHFEGAAQKYPKAIVQIESKT